MPKLPFAFSSSGLRHWLTGWLCLATLAPALAQPAASTEPQLRVEAGMHASLVRGITTDASGRIAVTAGDDKTARIWDVASGRLLQTLRPPVTPGDEGKLFAVALSADGNTVAVGGWTKLGAASGHAVYLFDRASGALKFRLAGSSNVVRHLAFSPDGRWLAAATYGGIQVWDWRAAGSPMRDSEATDTCERIQWSPDNRLAAGCQDGFLRLYRMQASTLVRLAKVTVPGGARPYGLAFSPDGRLLAVSQGESPRVDVLDSQSLALLYAPDVGTLKTSYFGTVAFSADSRSLVAGGGIAVKNINLVRRWPDAGRGTPIDIPTAGTSIHALRELPQGGWLLVAAGTWGIVTEDGRWQPKALPPIADFRQTSRLDADFKLAQGGRAVGFSFDYADPAQASRFDVTRRTLEAGPLTGGSSPKVDGLDIRDWRTSTRTTFNGKPMPGLQPNEPATSLAVAQDSSGFVLGSSWYLRHYAADGSLRWAADVPGSPLSLNIPFDGPQAGRMVVVAFGDGTIRWIRLSDGKELLALYAHTDRKRWVLWTPSGYYDASPGAEELIGWHMNRGNDQAADFFPAGRFRSKFYRPDVIDRVLDALSEEDAVRDADLSSNRRGEAAVAVAQVLPPVVELVSPGELSTGNSQVTIRVRGRTASDAPVTGWRLRVNGQAVADARGLGRQEAGGAAAGANERDLVVAVPAQDSEIQVFAENRNGVSTPATVRVRWAGAAPAQVAAVGGNSGGAAGGGGSRAAGGFVIQPKLYVLAVGVAAYQHKDIAKLGLPAKDARDFAAAMVRQQGRLYRQVEVKVLTDAQAGRDDIVDGLEWLQKQVTQHDVGMIFIAGHGVNDPTLGYTYLPVNADPDRLRRTGVPMDEFKRTLAALPGKAIFFFDTCHSGNVLGNKTRAGPNDVSGVINELASAENGVVVFSSSTGRQLSYEDPAWGNGAFTKALVEGLDGKADYQKNGRITHKMLDLYISERVKSLTGGKQSPVTQAPGGVPDFPVASSRQ